MKPGFNALREAYREGFEAAEDAGAGTLGREEITWEDHWHESRTARRQEADVGHRTPFEHLRVILAEVQDECRGLYRRLGPLKLPDGLGVGCNDAGIARDICQRAAEEGRLTWLHLMAEQWAEARGALSQAHLREQLLRVAVLAVAWVDAIDRRNVT